MARGLVVGLLCALGCGPRPGPPEGEAPATVGEGEATAGPEAELPARNEHALAARVLRFRLDDEVDTHDPDAPGPSLGSTTISCREVVIPEARPPARRLDCEPDDGEGAVLPVGTLTVSGDVQRPGVRLDGGPLDAPLGEDCSEERARGVDRWCVTTRCREAVGYGDAIVRACFDADGLVELVTENLAGPRRVGWSRL